MPSIRLMIHRIVRALRLGLAVGIVIACSSSEEPAAPAMPPEAAPPTAGGGASEDPFTPAGQTAAATITADGILQHVKVLGSDEFGGRGPASEGDRMTQQYLVEQLDALGYEPAAADGGWRQRFDIVGVNATVPDTWTFSAAGGRRWRRK